MDDVPGPVTVANPQSPAAARPAASIVIPAHNEAVALRRLLTALLATSAVGELDIVVVCNGCTDGTADVAREFGSAVRVIDLPEPSKRAALRQGDLAARGFPRLYVDADVVLGTDDVRSMLATLERSGVLACAPTRSLRRDRMSPLVRAYYDVWERLPQVREGLFGRGVIAVTEAGYARIRDLPAVMSDDLAVSLAFEPAERTIVTDARVAIWPPRSLRGLVRRRVRVHTGSAQIDAMAPRPESDRTGVSDLGVILRKEPRMAVRIPVFLGVAVFARAAARRKTRTGDFTTWLRDDSRDG